MKRNLLKDYSFSPSDWTLTILIAFTSKKLSLAHIVVIQIWQKGEFEEA